MKNQLQNRLDQRMYIPYGRQTITEQDIHAVLDVLQADYLTTGPTIEAFETQFSEYVGSSYAIAVSSGTAALHAAMFAIGIGPGDEVIVPPITFAATANAVVYQGATPVFADVSSDTLLIDPFKVIKKITPKTKAIIAVDYAGQPCDYLSLRLIAEQNNLFLISDACHALGAEYRGRRTGSLADITVFSFHPVKHITTGEGGMVTTDQKLLAEKMRLFRNHGINSDHRSRQKTGTWHYEMVELGYNYRISDIQCALGISQLRQLPDFLDARRKIARHYDTAFSGETSIQPLSSGSDILHAYHLYVVRIDFSKLKVNRKTIFTILHENGIGTNVHYIPVHLHPFYREKFHTRKGLCPVAEKAYDQILSLPIFSSMTSAEADYCSNTLKEVVESALPDRPGDNEFFESFHHIPLGESHA
ncbi:MAG: UDP-4-amino-4,6-dideoxy-N-acetyl-beta-L-altrosamine transaminase [Desulfobacterium sp.]|nr:UDP-4-amino-4,6-dideoxy-N-acetyl-beta-L-altrosamine transaminase [Desulfobacterium sp.]